MTKRVRNLKGLNSSGSDDNGDVKVPLSQRRRARKRKREILNAQELAAVENEILGFESFNSSSSDDDDGDVNVPLSGFLRARKCKTEGLNAQEWAAVKNERSGVENYNSSRSDDDGETNIPLSKFLRARKCKTKSLNAQELAAETTEMAEIGNDSLGVESFRVGDIVWAKAFPRTWLPGLIRKRSGHGVSVSFIDCERTRFFQESEICSFEKNFQVMSKKVGWCFSGVLESALDLFGRRVALGLICSCQSLNDRSIKQIVEVKKSFQSVGILSFVLNMAVSPTFEDTEIVGVTRAAAQVNAFRRYVFIKLDWIYRETMNLSESCLAIDDPEVMMKSTYQEMRSTSSSDAEVMHSVVQESEFSGDREDKHEVFSVQVGENFAVCSKSRADSKILDSDKEFGSLHEDRLEVFSKSSVSLEEDSISAKDLMAQNSTSCSASQHFNAEEISRTGVEFYVNSHSVLSHVANFHNEERKLCESDLKGHFHREASSECLSRVTLETKEQQWDSITSSYRDCEVDDSITNLVSLIPTKLYDTSARINAHGPEASLLIAGHGELQFPITSPMNPRVKSRRKKHGGKQSKLQSLHELLEHLQFVALDPFYSGTDCMETIFRTFLNFRIFSYQNIPDHASINYYLDEINEAQVLSHVGDGNNFETQSNSKVDVAAVIIDDKNEKTGIIGSLLSPLQSSHDCSDSKRSLKQPMKSSGDCFDSGRRLDEPMGSNLLFKLQKTQPFLSIHGADACFTKTRTEVEAHLPNDFSAKLRPRARRNSYKASSAQPMHDLITHIRCLALDPFYSGTDCSASVCQKILKLRYLMYQNILDLEPVEHTSDGSHEIEISKVQVVDSLSHIGEIAAKTQTKEVDGVNYAGSSELLSHVWKDIRIHPSDEISIEGKSEDVKGHCTLSYMQELSAVETVCKDVIGSDVIIGLAGDTTITSPLLSHLSDDPGKIQLSNKAGAMYNPTNREVNLGTVLEVSSNGKRTLSQPVASDISLIQRALPLLQPTKLYATSLSICNPTYPSNVQSQYPKTRSCSEVPTSLHMKFPKDFKLPSKDELLKKFCPFGSVDHLKTKVSFYTGSAKVVFLQQLDAVAAYKYAKRKKVLFGGANVRFWLDPHEHARRVTTNVPALLGLSALNLKSCLRTPYPLGEEHQRKPHSVKFITGNQISSLSTTVEKENRPFNVTDSPCKFSRVVGTDVSPRMLVLLEECYQLVYTIRESLGLRSYYSIFTNRDLYMTETDDIR